MTELRQFTEWLRNPLTAEANEAIEMVNGFNNSKSVETKLTFAIMLTDKYQHISTSERQMVAKGLGYTDAELLDSIKGLGNFKYAYKNIKTWKILEPSKGLFNTFFNNKNSI
jgi:hypothetical protein